MQQTPKLKILTVLTVVAFLSLMYGILTPAKRRGGHTPDMSAIELTSRSGSETAPSSFQRTAERTAKKMGYATWGRSPFLPKTESVVTRTKLVLAGIAWDDQSPKAVINDQIVGVGDTVGGNSVVSIQKDRVIMSDGSSDFELR